MTEDLCLIFSQQDTRLSALSLVKSSGLPAVDAIMMEDEAENKADIIKPDPNQMIPYKPKQIVRK